MLHAIVAHPQAADLAAVLRFKQGFPGAFAAGAAAVRSMEEDQVDVGEAGLGERLGDFSFGVCVG